MCLLLTGRPAKWRRLAQSGHLVLGRSFTIRTVEQERGRGRSHAQGPVVSKLMLTGLHSSATHYSDLVYSKALDRCKGQTSLGTLSKPLKLFSPLGWLFKLASQGPLCHCCEVCKLFFPKESQRTFREATWLSTVSASPPG